MSLLLFVESNTRFFHFAQQLKKLKNTLKAIKSWAKLVKFEEIIQQSQSGFNLTKTPYFIQ